MFLNKKIKMIAAVLCSAILLGGCANPVIGGNITKVVLTTGFSGNEVFRIEDTVCTLPEITVYLVNMQNEYENNLGKEIWSAGITSDSATDSSSEAISDGEKITLEDNLKQSCLSRMAKIKTMNLLAKESGITLSDDETLLASKAADEYYSSLSENDIEAMQNVSKDEITKLYEEYALANKLYEYTIKDINPEVSDDEARRITVLQMFIKTYTLDGSGAKVDVSDEEKQTAYNKLSKILAEYKSGTEFESLAEKYNEADETTISFGKGEVDENLEKAAFDLSTDEVSGIITTADGYEIIKCVTTFNKEETEANKVKIIEQRRKEAFGEQYDNFADGLTKEINEKLWDSITLSNDSDATTCSFFSIYEKYFKNDEES